MSQLVPLHSEKRVADLLAYARNKFNHQPQYSYTQNLNFAHTVVDHLHATTKHTVVAATVSGSVLRGVNTKDSDLDVTVVALNKDIRKPRSYHPDGIAYGNRILDVDVSVVPLDTYVKKLSSSPTSKR